MLNRKLLEVLSRLSAVEKKRLRQFLRSPYFNDSPHAAEIVRLYSRIIRYGASETHTALSKEAVFRFLFPDKSFQKNVKSPLDSLTTKLFHLVQRFLGQLKTEREGGELNEHLALAQFYRKFALEERFWQTMQTMRKMQHDSPLRDARHFHNQFQIEEEEQLFRGLYNTFEDDANLNAVHENLDLYYSILKLENTCALIYQKKYAQIEGLPTAELIECILNLSDDNGPFGIPINRIYRLLMNLLQRPHIEENLDKMESLIDQYQIQINSEKFKDLKAYIRFFLLQRYYRTGDDMSLHYTFDIYREHLSQGYFYYDNLIPFTSFRTLTVFALKLGEFDWVKTFFETHPPDRICGTRYPAEVHSLNMAEFYFYLKNYEAAQETLIYRHFENPTISIAADLLLVKIYYENQSELLDSRMRALDQKIRRSNLSRETKNRYYNFLKKLDKVIKYGRQPKNPKRARLIEEIKTMPDIIAREWLLEKLT